MDWKNGDHRLSFATLALLAFGLIALALDRGALLPVRPALAGPGPSNAPLRSDRPRFLVPTSTYTPTPPVGVPTDTPTPGSGFNKATSTPVDTDTPQPLIVDTEIPSATPTPSPTVPTATPTITPAPNYGNGDASALIDGHLDIGWLTSRIHGGFATIGFQGNALESVTGFVVDCAATGNVPDTADLKHFEVLFSSTSADPGAFVSGTTETCAQQTGLQRVLLSSPVQARYVQLQLIDNYGNSQVTGVAEFETLAQPVVSTARVANRSVHAHLVARVEVAQSAPALGKVAQIVQGLGIQPPNKPTRNAKLQQKVFTKYALHTKAAQQASVQFIDGTMLYMAQDTDAVLRSPTVTYVKNGIAEQKLQPGTTHIVRTAEATAAAIGTDFVIETTPQQMTLFVIEGAVLVQNKYGSEVVKTGQSTTVIKGQAPTAPTSFNSSATAAPNAWSLAMIDPHLPMNVALDANGGYIVGSSP